MFSPQYDHSTSKRFLISGLPTSGPWAISTDSDLAQLVSASTGAQVLSASLVRQSLGLGTVETANFDLCLAEASIKQVLLAIVEASNGGLTAMDLQQVEKFSVKALFKTSSTPLPSSTSNQVLIDYLTQQASLLYQLLPPPPGLGCSKTDAVVCSTGENPTGAPMVVTDISYAEVFVHL